MLQTDYQKIHFSNILPPFLPPPLPPILPPSLPDSLPPSFPSSLLPSLLPLSFAKGKVYCSDLPCRGHHEVLEEHIRVLNAPLSGQMNICSRTFLAGMEPAQLDASFPWFSPLQEACQGEGYCIPVVEEHSTWICLPNIMPSEKPLHVSPH